MNNTGASRRDAVIAPSHVLVSSSFLVEVKQASPDQSCTVRDCLPESKRRGKGETRER